MLSSWNLHWSSGKNVCLGWCLTCGYSFASCRATHSVSLPSWHHVYCYDVVRYSSSYVSQVPCNSKPHHLFSLVVFIDCSVALIVDWDGFPGCCDVYWYFHGWRHLRKGCWGLYVEYDLLHTGVNLLWLWEFWNEISAWWLCWTCWRNATVPFRSSISVWLPLCRWAICFL